MNVTLRNIGVVKYATFTLGDMTIICGKNNTGKTYANYSLYGFFDYWNEVPAFPIPEGIIQQLFTDGSVRLPVSLFIGKAEQMLATQCAQYSKMLPYVFATSEKRFPDSTFTIKLTDSTLHPLDTYEKKISSAKTHIFSIVLTDDEIVVTLLVDKANTKIPAHILRDEIGKAVKAVVFGQVIPRAFIVSTERTGAAIFRSELNFARNRLIDELGSKDKDIDPFKLLNQFDASYALPVRRNVDFTRHLETFSKSESFLVQEHPEVLHDFASILGGKYEVTRNDELLYVPQGKKIKLTMDESSSSVRSLLDLGFYLRHIARQGDLLMIDEPELNLHPQNQRLVARLLARLVNLGIKVFVTTHSDYLVKELNTLIMLARDDSRLKALAAREGYKTDELLSFDKVKVYVAQEDLVQCPEGKRRSRCQTLVPADVNEEGMNVSSFDDDIEDLARIHDEIIWGDK
jgi:hypothetical protein